MNQITITPSLPVADGGVFSSLQAFENAQRMAKALSSSTLVPKDYQNNLGNSLIALEMSQRLKASPLLVMQNLYVVHGKPSWSSQFLIACCNQSGRFSALQYEFSGKEGADDLACRAYATELQSGEVVRGPWASIAMSKKEGWYSKNGSKWQTMPELMLTYRAASFFVRTKAPEIAMGMSTVEEAKDMGPAERVFENAPVSSLDDELMAPVSAPEQVSRPDVVAEVAEGE